MLNDDILNKVDDLMASNEMIFLKGQLINLQQCSNTDGEIYFLSDLKVPRSLSTDNVYGVSFNVYHVCFSNKFLVESNLDIETFKSFKNNEVLLSLSSFSSVKSVKKEQTYKFNNIKFFVNDLMLTKSLEKPNFSTKKVVNL